MSKVEELLEELIFEVRELRGDLREIRGGQGYDISDIFNNITHQGSEIICVINEAKSEFETFAGSGPLGIAEKITGPTGYNLEDLHNALISLETAIDTK